MSANKNDFRKILNSLSTDTEILHQLYQFLVNSIQTANKRSPKGWALYEMDGGIIFMIRNVYTVNIGINTSGTKIEGVQILAAKSLVTGLLIEQLKELGCSIGEGFKNTGDSYVVSVSIKNPENFVESLKIVQPAHEKFIQNVLKPGTSVIRWQLHNPAITEFLRTTLKTNIPDPGYFVPIHPPKTEGEKIKMQTFEMIDGYLKSKGYSFTPTQIASFYTALQTKGFVILSGISGTGKTKLAQLFAEMLPSPGQKGMSQPENVISVVLESGYDLSPVNTLIESLPSFQAIDLKQRITVPLNFNRITQPCEIRLDEYPDKSQHLLFWLQDEAIQWFEQNYPAGSNLYLKPEITDNKLVGLTVLENPKVESNCLFTSVRPDWRDSKSLLGYYNPLTKSYQWTPFLEFLIKARNSYDNDDGQAWFVILDEMNLARVEYYFADLLSVLESGRDDEGNTKEPLRFQFDEIEKGQKPPQHIYLPPNLYIIGTVNMDETTQSFSPKVLDRAFSIEFLDVDFSTYKLSISDKPDTLGMPEREALQESFTRDGVFAKIDKREISQFSELGKFRQELTALNEKLAPYNHHFGYRVFDEIMMFLKNAQENKMYKGMNIEQSDESMLESAFDQAVLMKVLPKFHGSRGKLEKPLNGILAWCAKPDFVFDPEKEFKSESWRYPATARRVVRMIQSLNSTGFASFG